jgi:hypothetical protein
VPEVGPDALTALPYKSDVLLANTPSNDSLPADIDVSVPLASPDAPHYIHVYLALENYLSCRGAWVEGSATIDFKSISITYSRAVIPDPDGGDEGDISLRLPLRMIGTPYLFALDEDTNNLSDNWLKLDWGSKALSSGRLVQAGGNVGEFALAPYTEIVGNRVRSRGYAFEAYNVSGSAAGRSLWLTPFASMVGETPIVIVVHSSATMPPADSAQTWRGGGATEIGMAAASVTAGEPVEVPIHKDPAERVWVFVSLAPVPEADAGLPAIGFPNSRGIDLVDAHISRRYIPDGRARKGVLVYNASPEMRDRLRTLAADPFTQNALDLTHSIIHQYGTADMFGNLIIPNTSGKWYDMNGVLLSGYAGNPYILSNYFMAQSPFTVFAGTYNYGLIKSDPSADLPAGMKNAANLDYYTSFFYSNANNWLMSDYGKTFPTIYGPGMTADPADRAILDGCVILAVTPSFFVGLSGVDYSLFIANSTGVTNFSPDNTAVRAIQYTDIKKIVMAQLHCGIVRNDGTLLIARTTNLAAIDTSALTDVKDFAFAGTISLPGQSLALKNDGTFHPVAGAAVPPGVLQHNITSLQSGIGSSNQYIQLFFYDDTP